MNILIVDDEYYSVQAIQQQVCWESLAEEEVHVFSAYNSSQAREILKKETIDILLCDIEMPMGSGLELIEWIRERQLVLEIVIITCHASFEYAKEAIDLKVSAYCVKPLEFTELEETLRKLSTKIKEQKAMKGLKIDRKTRAVSIPSDILKKLELGKLEEFSHYLHLWLKNLEQEGRLTPELLYVVRINSQQAIHHFLMKREIPASVLQAEEVGLAYQNACDSRQAMEQWVKQVLRAIHAESRVQEKQANNSFLLVRQMKEYMEEHLDQGLTREQIAESVHLNPDYAARIFKREEQETMMDFLNKRQIARAALLMDTTDLSIGEIASRTGFSNASFFSTAFKRIMGVSPRNYRKSGEKKVGF